MHVERAILWAKCLGVGSEEILVVVTGQVASPTWSPCQPARATNAFPDMSKGKSTSCCEKGTCSLDLQF